MLQLIGKEIFRILRSKYMLQLIGKEIFTILRSKILYMRSQDASVCFALCSFLCNLKYGSFFGAQKNRLTETVLLSTTAYVLIE